MDIAGKILKAMKSDRWYGKDEIAAQVSANPDTVRQVLNMLVKSRMIDVDPPEKYRRNKKYQTKQRSLL